MNAQATLQTLVESLELQKHWIDGRFGDIPSALTRIADQVIAAAEELQRLKQERLNQLAEEGPMVHQSPSGDIHVTILRQGKEEFYHSGEHYIVVEQTSKDEVREHFKLTGPPENDGKTYMMRFKPLNADVLDFAVQVSSWEAKIINKQLKEIEMDD